jgi:hAT family C-terminal dimerisation region
MQRDLERSRAQLQAHYHANYVRDPSPNAASTPSMSSVASSGSPQKVDFTLRYKKQVRAYIDELDEFFKLPQENFDTCDPIQWWVGRCSQFPNLSRLARDILSIPG